VIVIFVLQQTGNYFENGVMLLQLHIIIENTREFAKAVDFFAIIKDILIPSLIVLMMWLGVRAISRIQAKSEDAIFSFYSRFQVYLKLILKALGTEGVSVLYYMFQEDIRRREYIFNIPTPEELKQFKDLIDDILNFLKNSDGQISSTKKIYEQRKKFIEFIIEEKFSLGVIYPYGDKNGVEKLRRKFQDYTSLINDMIDEIEILQKKLLTPIWKMNKKKIECIWEKITLKYKAWVEKRKSKINSTVNIIHF